MMVSIAKRMQRDFHWFVRRMDNMTRYELDTAADQIVRWLKDEMTVGKQSLQVRATREYVREPVIDRETAGLDEDTDASSLLTIGVLDAWPAGVEDGWRLQVRVEDIVGPHTPEEESVPTGPEEIDLDDFETNFIAPDRGTAFVSVEVDSSEAKQRFDNILANMMRNQHGK